MMVFRSMVEMQVRLTSRPAGKLLCNAAWAPAASQALNNRQRTINELHSLRKNRESMDADRAVASPFTPGNLFPARGQLIVQVQNVSGHLLL
jgi:hypothetical protein